MFLLLALAILGYGIANADVTDELTVTTFGVEGTSYKEVTGIKVSSSAIYSAQMAGDKSSIQLRSNNNNSGIVTTASGGNVKSIKVEWHSDTNDARVLKVYGKSAAYSAPTDLYGDDTQGTEIASFAKKDGEQTITIDGSYQYIGFRSNSGAMYITKITIVWDGEGGGSTVTVKTPVISGTTPFTESTQVSISGPDGGSTYYTTDGSTPSKTNGTVYTAPFTITETTTVKAIGYDEDDNASSVAEMTFTKQENVTAENIAAFNALAHNTKNVVLTLKDAQVLSAGNNNIVIKDATASTLIYDRNLKFTQGQILNGTITGTRQDYNGFTEISSVSANTITATDGTITPKTATPEEVIAAGYFANLYKMEKVECKLENDRYYITVGDNKIQVYDNHKLGFAITADGTFNVTGVLGAYKDVPYQFWLTEAPEATQTITYPEAANIAAVKDIESGTTVKLTLKDAVVNYVNGTNDMFVEDATGAIDLYRLGIEAKAGDVLNGTIIVKYSPYNNLPEVVAVTGVTVTDDITVTDGTAPTPKEMSIADAAKIENACKLVTIKNITLVAEKVEDKTNYYADADKTLQVFDKYKVGYTPNTESAMDYTGILIPFKEQFQICPTVEPTASQGGGETPVETSKAIYYWMEGFEAANEIAFEDGAKIAITGNTSKTISGAKNITVDGTEYKTMKLSNGAQNTLTMPEGCNVVKMTFYSYINKASTAEGLRTSYWKEVAGETYDETTALSCYNDGDFTAPDVREFTLKTPANAVTFTNTGEQLCYVLVVEYTKGGSASVNSIEVEKAKNNIRYNLAGQRVDESYKGVVIMNGKKFVVK